MGTYPYSKAGGYLSSYLPETKASLLKQSYYSRRRKRKRRNNMSNCGITSKVVTYYSTEIKLPNLYMSYLQKKLSIYTVSLMWCNIFIKNNVE